MQMHKTFFLLLLNVLVINICNCSLSSVDGGSSETGNSRVAGLITADQLSNTTNVTVELVPQSFIPSNISNDKVYTTKTDNKGIYCFEKVIRGVYYVYAKDINIGRRALAGPFDISLENNSIENITINPSGKIIIEIPDTINSGMLFIKGTTSFTQFDSSKNVTLDSVPYGNVTLMMSTGLNTNTTTKPIVEVTVSDTSTIVAAINNRPPVFITRNADIKNTFTLGITYTDSIRATDPDSDRVQYEIINGPATMTIDSFTGKIQWLPPADTTKFYSIGVRVKDIRGASSIIRWIISNVFTNAPTPGIPVGLTQGITNTSYTYNAQHLSCADPEYLFSWGDGDTTTWSDSSTALHVWNKPGIFNVTAKVRCAAYPFASEWSLPLAVSITSPIKTQKPSLISSSLNADTQDTITFSTDSNLCENAFYRFYIGDSIITPWQKLNWIRYAFFLEGTYSIQVQTSCDTADSSQSVLSEPVSILISSIAIYAPQPIGDTLIITANGDSAQSTYFIKYIKDDSTATYNYRFSLSTGYTTAWSPDTFTNINIASNTSAFEISAQVRRNLRNRITTSEWSAPLLVNVIKRTQ
jgi:hypothetical protein